MITIFIIGTSSGDIAGAFRSLLLRMSSVTSMLQKIQMYINWSVALPEVTSPLNSVTFRSYADRISSGENRR